MTGTRPILRWAGGKYQLTAAIRKLLPAFLGRYVEPMVGGGALFFSILPEQAILSDINPELINFYRVLRDQPGKLIDRMMAMRASTDSYYKLRSTHQKSALWRAVRFVYLNRLCWNGLYRVNLEGEFNVPIGSRLPKVLWVEENLWAASTALQNADIRNSDFSYVLRSAKEGDCVFIDPPYPRGSRTGIGFNRYSQKRFGIAEHRRLSQWLEKLDHRGVSFVVTLSRNDFLSDIYPERFFFLEVSTMSLIGSTRSSRTAVVEIILTNCS